MFKEEQRRYAQLGGDYFWFEGKRRLVWTVFEKSTGTKPAGEDILDIGCGPGFAFAEMAGWKRIHGLDPSLDALSACKRASGRSSLLVNGSADRLPYRDGSFSAVVAFEIFEHLDNDREAMQECLRILKPGGRLILTVPAFQWLWGDHDELYFHKRRYRTAELRKNLASVGFTVERLTYCLAPFVLPLWLMRRGKRLFSANNKKKDDFVRPPLWANRLLTKFITAEALLLKHWDLPCGVSIIGIARKA